MARTKKQDTTELAPVTRAEKKDATKKLITTLLAEKPYKHNELIEEVSKIYAERYAGEDTENINDVKGRVGSVLDIMKKDSDIMYDGGMYALKARVITAPPVQEETPAPKKRGRKPKAEKKEEEAQPLPPAPLQPIAPVAPITPEVAPEPIPEEKKAPTPKKRGRKPKAEAKAEETPSVEPVQEEAKEETALVVQEKTEVAKPAVVMDMSFLFGEQKSVKAEEKKEPVKEAKKEEKPESKKEPEVKQTEPKKVTIKPVTRTSARTIRKPQQKPLTANERLCEEFLKRIRRLGGEYFEYYSVYLLERYSLKNGRRLEGLKISGGEHDGGIDGEIELTDKLGFRETIYIQSKNWNPEKGDEKLWVVGETLLQQFIGACACRQAKDRKQNCRGIFITTSRFTPEAKRILEDMSDKIVGYDGEDLFEAAKECSFGVIEKNGVWSLDEKLLSGTKAFFNLY